MALALSACMTNRHALRLLLLFEAATLLGAASCVDRGAEQEDGESALGATFSRRTTNPNAQFVATWLHRDSGGTVSFASPISSPDGHLVVHHTQGAGNAFFVAVVVPPPATSHTGTAIAPRFGDDLLVRDGAGAPVLVPIAAPAAFGWTQNTSEQMALGSDPRLAGGMPVRVAASGAAANCFAADPATVVTAVAGPYECGRYLLFMPGRSGTSASNTIHVAAVGVVTDAYAPGAATVRKARPAVVAARFLSGFAALPVGSIGIELSVTADSRLLLSHAGHSRFSWSETPWIASSWELPRNFTCIATATGKVCPGDSAASCATNPTACGMADRPVCLAGRGTNQVCQGSQPLFRDRYPVAQYPLRNSDGSLYAGRTVDGSLQPNRFGGTYGWITFDGDAFFFNSSSNRGSRAVVGRLTRGMIRTLDAQANVTPIAYCVAANQLRPVAGCPGGTDSDGLRQPRIPFALCATNLFGPFAAGNLEQITRFAPVVDDPVEMGADQPPYPIPRAAGFTDRREDGGVIAAQDFKKQGAGQFLLRPEEMKEAAVGGARTGADRRHRCALEAVAVEHRQARRQQILARRGHRSRPRSKLDHYSRVIL